MGKVLTDNLFANIETANTPAANGPKWLKNIPLEKRDEVIAARIAAKRASAMRNYRKMMATNPEIVRKRRREWHARYRDRELERARLYKKNNPQIIKLQMDRWRSVPRNRMKSIISSRIADAKRRGIQVDEIAMRELITHPPEVCAISGHLLDYSVRRGRNIGMSPSVDRIRPELGYIRGNIAVVGHRFNTIKSFGTAEEHRLVAAYLDKSNDTI